MPGILVEHSDDGTWDGLFEISVGRDLQNWVERTERVNVNLERILRISHDGTMLYMHGVEMSEPFFIPEEYLDEDLLIAFSVVGVLHEQKSTIGVYPAGSGDTHRLCQTFDELYEQLINPAAHSEGDSADNTDSDMDSE